MTLRKKQPLADLCGYMLLMGNIMCTVVIVYRRMAIVKTWLTKVNCIFSAINPLALNTLTRFLTLLLRGEVVSVSSTPTVVKFLAFLGDFIIVMVTK